jgi:hypothetical protein
MAWTKELPKGPGWYWVREKVAVPGSKTEAWEWTTPEIMLCFQDCQDEPVVQKMGSEDFETLESWEENAEAEWWGPIEEPENEVRPDTKNPSPSPQA